MNGKNDNIFLIAMAVNTSEVALTFLIWVDAKKKKTEIFCTLYGQTSTIINVEVKLINHNEDMSRLFIRWIAKVKDEALIESHSDDFPKRAPVDGVIKKTNERESHKSVYLQMELNAKLWCKEFL